MPKRTVRIDWPRFNVAWTTKAAQSGLTIWQVATLTGVNHGTVSRCSAILGAGMGAEAYLAICHWLGVHPYHFVKH